MTLGDALSLDQIIPEMEATDHWPAIQELVDHLNAKGKIRPEAREPILAALKQREEAMSTGIGGGVAIPHTFSDEVNEVVAAFGRSSQGIEFSSLDNQPVSLIALFIVPENQYQLHLRTLAAIAKYLNDKRTRQAILDAPGPAEILHILKHRPGATPSPAPGS